ncbi:BLUF domain-containing protein, partial [Methylobacterium sp. E-016]|uniref:BLUF domain-containing protein n=1 Tax=Methylobacterium sp. E-016 TaxID=2836556 RepID=UPI001FBB452C
NNGRSNVSGALMFNAGAFAQVLEGPRRQVEETFERIQCDDRHGDVTVLQCGPTEKRSFANWSMAFVGQSAGGQAQFSRLAAESGFDLSRLDGDAVFAMLHGLVLEEERVPAPVANASPAEVHSAMGLDVEQLRTEIAQLRREDAAPRIPPAPDAVLAGPIAFVGPRARPRGEATGSAGSAADAALSVLKTALASERQRTSELRTEIDALQVALVLHQDQMEALQTERDRWAERARLLAAAMVQEAGDIHESSHPSGHSGARSA